MLRVASFAGVLLVATACLYAAFSWIAATTQPKVYLFQLAAMVLIAILLGRYALKERMMPVVVFLGLIIAWCMATAILGDDSGVASTLPAFFNLAAAAWIFFGKFRAGVVSGATSRLP